MAAARAGRGVSVRLSAGHAALKQGETSSPTICQPALFCSGTTLCEADACTQRGRELYFPLWTLRFAREVDGSACIRPSLLRVRTLLGGHVPIVCVPINATLPSLRHACLPLCNDWLQCVR